MQFVDLFNADIKDDLVDSVKDINLEECSNDELMVLENWIHQTKERADFLTLEDEIVGYTYKNLEVLTPKLNTEESKRGIQLVKKIK